MGQIFFKEESYRIIGACLDVYREIGNGFLEAVYQECLGLELADQGIPFERKPRMELRYRHWQLTQLYTPDFLCFGEIILELKAVSLLNNEHRAQVINYLKGTGRSLGLLVNFGHHPGLEHERLVG